MKTLLTKLLLKLGILPSAQILAAHLRQPQGKIGKEIGKRMNHSNQYLFDWVLSLLDIKPQQQLLEIGFGNGNFFENVFAKAEGITITGIDFSEAMYNEALINCAARVKANQLHLNFGSSDKLPFADNSFDKVYCTNVLYFWENPQHHLAEIYRVLKPGGRFYAGIRDKETMLMMPFTQYGFALRSNTEWQEVVENSPLKFITIETMTEPETSFNGKPLVSQSGCIVAEK
jgi:SAM-dependent methyltransferase